jgi:hypothetical protein
MLLVSQTGPAASRTIGGGKSSRPMSWKRHWRLMPSMAAADDTVPRQAVGERLQLGMRQLPRFPASARTKILHRIASAVLISFRMSSPSWNVLD